MKSVLLRIARCAPCFVLPVLIQSGCLSPTFDGADVRRGLHGWAGVVGCHRSLDYRSSEFGSTENGLGLGGAGGIYYGITERLAMGLGASGFIIVSGDDQREAWNSFPQVSYNFKYEFTAASSPIVFSSALEVGLVGLFPRLCPMVGLKQGDTEVIGFGMHIAPIPYDIFLTVKPSPGSGPVAYVGHQILWIIAPEDEGYKPGNIAVGIGYRW